MPRWLSKLIVWSISLVCFGLVFRKIAEAAARDGLSSFEYLSRFFSEADWLVWLGVMIPYSCFFFLIDAHVTWRVVKWFNANSFEFKRMLPIRASAYILSLVNEQVGKGAISVYLWKKHQVPGWQALSSMLLLGMMEIYQLLIFSCIGVFLYFDLVTAASSRLPLDKILPTVFLVAAIYFPIHILYFRGKILKAIPLRNLQLARTFTLAKLKHYVLIVLFKAPNLIGAVLVYTFSLGLFQVSVSFGQMLAFLPVIFLAAALPLPFHAGALLLWTVLFPDYPEVGVFSLIMHTFFVLFNALIGLVFLPTANRELFDN
ncbi:MAG: hypothetical protein AAF387_09940 [Pseudomonadota bacterium]